MASVANTKTRLIIQLDKSYGKVAVDSFQFKDDKCIVTLVPTPDFGIHGSVVKQGGWKYETANVPGRSRKPKFGNTQVFVEHLLDGTIRLTTCEPLRPLMLRHGKKPKPEIVTVPVVPPTTMKEELLSLRDCVNRVNAIKTEIGDDLVLSIVDGKLKALVEY